MIERLKESDYCSPLITGSIGTMVVSFMSAVILGPNYCHSINLFALCLTLIALVILIRNFKEFTLFKKGFLILIAIINLSLGIFLISIKYGYFAWHYVNLFRLEV